MGIIVDDLISTVLSETQERMTGIDQDALRRILEDSLSGFDVTQKEGTGRPSDLPDKIEAYLLLRLIVYTMSMRNKGGHQNGRKEW